MAYVYEHWRPDTGICFYVGKGSGNRAWLSKRRNKYHAVIVEKLETIGLKIDVRIIADGLTDDAAFELEERTIAHWRNEGVKLANASSGGRGGLSGCLRSLESRQSQSKTTKGRKLTDEQKAGRIAWVRSDVGRATISAIHKGRKRPPETGAKISAAMKAIGHKPPGTAGKVFSAEVRERMRQSRTPEIRAALSEATKKQWANPVFRKLVSDTMKATNARRAAQRAEIQP